MIQMRCLSKTSDLQPTPPLRRELVWNCFTMSGKRVPFKKHQWPIHPPIFYIHVDAPVCLYAYVFEGVCLYSSVTVYTLTSPGHLGRVCVVPSGESAHMCLHEDLVLCGCVFDKLWEHVGDCLSIHLGESGRERAEWGGGRDLLPASYLQVNLLAVTQTSLSPP